MKTRLIIATVMMCISLPTLAQLKVSSNGKVYVQMTDNYDEAMLNVGDGPYRDFFYYYLDGKVGAHVHNYFTQEGDNYGIVSEAFKNGSWGNAIGVFGYGKGAASNQRNYGVLGTIYINATGAAVCGTTEGGVPPSNACNGNYAGYFYGDTYADGALTVTNGFYNLSDMRLKEDVVSITDIEEKDGSTLENLKQLDVLQYALKDVRQAKAEQEGQPYEAKLSDQATKDLARRHYGLSAQELQKVYPELVRESQEGFLTVNYTELVPILIRSIQELKAELDELKDKGFVDSVGADPVSARNTNPIEEHPQSTASIDDTSTTTSAVLFQNTPNPFNAQTEIRFSLPDHAPQAYIYIFDMTGKMQKQIPVDASQQSVTINGYELSAGIYLYSLVVGGQEIDTKRMILSK